MVIIDQVCYLFTGELIGIECLLSQTGQPVAPLRSDEALAVDDSNLTALADEDEGYIEMDSSVTEYIEDLTLHVVVESSPLSVTAKHQLQGNEDRDSSASPRKRANRPLEMPVPELSTVYEPVLSLDPCLSVADFHPEYEYVDDQLISQPLLMSSQHTSTRLWYSA